MDSKTCFKCGETKSLDDFYKHPRMADGHLNKCKNCTRRDSEERRLRKEKDPAWVIAERARHRLKSRKYRDDGRAKPLPNGRKQNPHKEAAKTAVGNAVSAGKLIKGPCMVCGSDKVQGHHEDYSKPLEVNWLCVRHHHDRHIYIRDCEILGMDPLPITEQEFPLPE